MCGIAGIYAKNVSALQQSIISDIIDNQRARGPDHSAVEKIEGRHCEVVFGHNRLSIIDLSSDSNQPLWDVTGRYCISYNGEIYNYIELRETLKNRGFVFETMGDTEVILNAFSHWGVEALLYFNGPFAFSLFDSETETLWLCRDRFGVRPLYYILKGEALYFASSVSVLATALGLTPDLNYVASGLKYLVYENGESNSPFQKLQSLQAGHVLTVSMKRNGAVIADSQQYYDFDSSVQSLQQTLPVTQADELLQMISAEFEHAVSLRLRSDVPIGITLSSGLDSSTVAAAVSMQTQKTIGFSYGHPLQKRSEGPLTQTCADFLGIQMEYVSPCSTALIEGLFSTIAAQEAPFSGLSVVAQYLLYQHINNCGIKVILGGQGGDEGFMGYRKFVLFWMKSLLGQRRYVATAKNFLQFMPLFISELTSIKTYWKQRHRYLSQRHLTSVLRLPEAPTVNLNIHYQENITDRQVRDVTRFSLPTLLRYEDRNAMGNSVESRLPFMDYKLLELGVALPAALKLRAGYGKWPIRQMMQGKIPDSIRLAHYKRGFDISLQSMLSDGLGAAIRSALHALPNVVAEFLKPGNKIEAVFSDAAFIHRPRAVSEAIALLWLGRFIN